MIEEVLVKGKKILLRLFSREKAYNICYKGEQKSYFNKGVLLLNRSKFKLQIN